MSEYQYYEFQALDRPLNQQEQAEIRALSSRVELTPRQAVFTYSYGDFRGDPLKVLVKHFDALLYLANWGSKRLAFRLPRSLVDAVQLQIYSGLDEISLTTTEQYVVLDMNFGEPDGDGEWIEGAGLLANMLPLRDDILRGDLRAPYLVWLKAAALYDADEWDDQEVDERDDEDDAEADSDELLEPPMPAGLRTLSPALEALIAFFEIDPDLIAAAAEASPALGRTDDRVEQWVTRLPEAERNAWLVRVAQGEPHVGMQLVRRLRELGGQMGATSAASAPRRSFAALQAAAAQQKQRRKEHERQQAERARLSKLDALAQREPATWTQVTALIEQKNARSYDEATALLIDLRDLARHRGQLDQFAARVATIGANYSNRPSFLERLRKAGLLAA